MTNKEKLELIKLHELRGLKYKGNFVENLTEIEFESGLIKFLIEDEDDEQDGISENIWGWITDEYKNKYNDKNFNGIIKAILTNSPINYYGLLFWGTEVEVICNKNNRPKLNKEWINNIIYNLENKEE